MLLYWLTRFERTSWAAASTTGADPVLPLKALPEPAAVPPIVPIVEEAASFVVVMVIVPVESTVANRLLPASAVLRSFSDLTVPLVPLPNVRLVAVPLPVAPIVSVRPPRAAGPPPRAVVRAERPGLARPEPLTTRSCAVPVCRVIAPPEIVEVAPVMALTALITSPTVPVVTSIDRVPAVAEPLVPEPLLKEMVLPSTTIVSDAVKSLDTESVFAPPDSRVEAVIGAGVVKLLLTTLPAAAEASV